MKRSELVVNQTVGYVAAGWVDEAIILSDKPHARSKSQYSAAINEVDRGSGVLVSINGYKKCVKLGDLHPLDEARGIDADRKAKSKAESNAYHDRNDRLAMAASEIQALLRELGVKGLTTTFTQHGYSTGVTVVDSTGVTLRDLLTELRNSRQLHAAF